MRRRRTWEGSAVALLVLGTLTAAGVPASADEDPLGDLTTTVEKRLEPATGAVTQNHVPRARTSTPSSDPGEPSSSDTSGANDVADPQAPDHAGAQALDVDVAGERFLDVGRSRSTVEDDDSASADASALAVGGTEVVPGAHADSSGSRHDESVGLGPATDPACDESSGAVCFDVLYAEANATDDGETSHSDSQSGIVTVCLGGEDPDACDAPLQSSVGSSSSRIDRDQRSGRTTASSESELASVCLSSPDESPSASCVLGAALLTSQGRSDSGDAGDAPSASRESSVGSLTILGTEQSLDEDQGLELPPGCPPAESLACAYLNQGETYLGGGLAGHAQEALKVRLLPGIVEGADLLHLIGARSETLVHNDGGESASEVAGEQDTSNDGAARAPVVAGVESATDGGVLPNTGGPALGLLSLGLLGLGLGAMLIAVSRSTRLLAQQHA